MQTETRAMTPPKNSGPGPWRPDLLLTPKRGTVRVVCDVRPSLIGVIPWMTAYFHRPKRPPHLVRPFGLN